MRVPVEVRERMRARLWQLADEVNWILLSDADKGKYYRNWTSDAEIGGILSRYMEVGQVRTYIKDAVLKVYARQRMADARSPLTKLGLSASNKVAQTFIKPHGVKLADGRVICWGRAMTWKAILMALHERSFADQNAYPYGAVLLQSNAGFADGDAQAVVENAATKLGIRKLAWV
jgi:hypothetical protein